MLGRKLSLVLNQINLNNLIPSQVLSQKTWRVQYQVFSMAGQQIHAPIDADSQLRLKPNYETQSG